MAATAIPDLTDPRVVAADDIAAFRRDGHVLLQSVASPEEVAAFRPAICSAAAQHSRETRPLAERDTYGQAFLQVWNLWQHDPVVARFVLASRFASIAADLLGVGAVRLYHDQALFKEPGGGRTPWHQDAIYWPLDGTRCVTMWMPLVDVTVEMGGVTFASGSHAAGGSLGETAISDASDEHFAAVLTQRRSRLCAPVAMSAGDATFHGGWTLHRADPNVASTMREVMTVIYFAAGLRVLEPCNPQQRHDLATWLPGLGPGDLAATAINPLLQ